MSEAFLENNFGNSLENRISVDCFAVFTVAYIDSCFDFHAT